MSEPIIIPARDWVGSVPAGCPYLFRALGKWNEADPMPHHCVSLPRGCAIDLSPPPLDADGFPERVDALPVVRERLRALDVSGHLGLPADGALRRDLWRQMLVALFAFRGPNGERAWEVGRG